jgi:hypothetical protein
MDKPETTVIDSVPEVAVSGTALPSLTLTVKLYVPAPDADMVPEKVPFWAKERPGGSEFEGLVRVQVYGGVPPEALNAGE